MPRKRKEIFMGILTKKHSIGKTIAELRKEKGWTQVELAEKLQVSDKTVSKWEKDNGAPSVEFFPALAEVLGVSIDYIMTGKKVEPEIITMSKIELCAKNDDVKLLGKFGINSKDENGKTLLYYVKKYNSKKVLTALFDRSSWYEGFLDGSYKNRNEALSEAILLFIPIDREIKFVENTLNKNAYKNGILDITNVSEYKYPRIIKYLVRNYDTLSSIQKKYYFDFDKIAYDKSKRIFTYACWTYAYRYFIDYAYDINKPLFNLLVNRVFEGNNAYDERFTEYKKKGWDDRYIKEHLMECSCKITILKSTLLKCLNNSDMDTFNTLMAIQHEPITEYEIKMAKLKNDKSISQEELLVQSTIHNDVVCIDELLELKDFKLIKKTLNEYPIHILEKLYAMYSNKKWRQLFEYAVDNNNTSLAEEIAKRDLEQIEKILLSYWSDPQFDKLNINEKHLYIDNIRVVPRTKIYHSKNTCKYLDECCEKLKLVKQRIIAELSLKLDKDKIVGELTKEYFECELSKGNIDMVIIKLCVRLEAILRSDYHYEGDFSEMLNKYCSQFNTYDDEDNNYDPYTPHKLNKLRIQRNGIVHSEKGKETLTTDEIKWCIDYICKIG